jgi:hypothetical protein
MCGTTSSSTSAASPPTCCGTMNAVPAARGCTTPRRVAIGSPTASSPGLRVEALSAPALVRDAIEAVGALLRFPSTLQRQLILILSMRQLLDGDCATRQSLNVNYATRQLLNVNYTIRQLLDVDSPIPQSLNFSMCSFLNPHIAAEGVQSEVGVAAAVQGAAEIAAAAARQGDGQCAVE